MIIFGISSSERAGTALTDRCPHCGERNLVGSRRFRYFHLFWLPVIPLGSAVAVTCEHCQLAMEKADLEPAQKDRAVQGCRDLKRPRWHFIGTLVVAGLIGMNMHDDARLEEKALAAAAEPHVGDVWIIDVRDAWGIEDDVFRYGVGRVSEVNGDEVGLSMSDWSYLVSSGARKDALEAISEQDKEYFGDDVTVSISATELVAFQATDDFRLLR